MPRGVRLTSFLALAVIAALAAFVSQRDSSTAQLTFDPGAFICFEVTETSAACDGDPSPGAATDLHSSFCIGWNSDCSVKDAPVTDSNFGGVIGFTPPEYTVPSGNDIPIGTIVGRLTAESTLGILNNACNVIIGVAFTIMNASIDINDTISPKPPGSDDVMEPLALDANGNGLQDGVDKYPAFLNETFDGKQPRARLFGVSLIQGSWITLNFVFFEPGESFEVAGDIVTLDPALGVPSVTVLLNPEAPAAAGVISDFCAPLLSDNISLGVTIDNPCTTTPQAVVNGAACPGTTVFENCCGYPLFPCETNNAHDEDGDGFINDGCPQVGAIAETGAQCNNNISDDPEDSDVNDGCPQVGDKSEATRIGGSCSGANEGGCIFRQNPASAGTVTFTTLTASQRDADGDGIENSLDVCWDVPNPEWNPRANDPANDSDGDGIPNVCDPEPNGSKSVFLPGCPAGVVGADHDEDCYSNRQDNCPTDNQLENANLPPDATTNLSLPEDRDSDGVGDECDPDPDCADCQGEPAFVCLNMALGVGGGATKAVGVADADRSLDCATTSIVEGPGASGSPTPTPVGQTPTPVGQTPQPLGGVGGPDTGVGSLAPTATNASIWAIVLAVLGGVGVLAGIRILRARRVDREK